jgi:hypothetical protein
MKLLTQSANVAKKAREAKTRFETSQERDRDFYQEQDRLVQNGERCGHKKINH